MWDLYESSNQMISLVWFELYICPVRPKLIFGDGWAKDNGGEGVVEWGLVGEVLRFLERGVKDADFGVGFGLASQDGAERRGWLTR